MTPKSKFLQKKAIDGKDLPGYGKSYNKTPEQYAEALGIPLMDLGNMVAIFGSEDFTIDFALVNCGAGSSQGLAGAPIHVDGAAFSPMMIIKQYDHPILAVDATQGALQELGIAESQNAARINKLLDKAEALGMEQYNQEKELDHTSSAAPKVKN